MSPNSVHFNGSINLTNAEAVMREIAARVPTGIRRIPDGETGDRHGWVFCQLQKFWQTPGIEKVATKKGAEGYAAAPKVRLADGVNPETLKWPNLGYADGYQESFRTFKRLRAEGTVPADVRFQVQYPTPLASVGIRRRSRSCLASIGKFSRSTVHRRRTRILTKLSLLK